MVMAAAAAGVRAVLNRAKSWASGRGNQLVKGKPSVTTGDTQRQSYPMVVVGRRCYSQSSSILPSHINFDTDFTHQFTPVSCAHDDKGVLFAADFAVTAFNDYSDEMEPTFPRIRLLRVVKASAIRIGLSIHSLLLGGITEKGDLNVYRALVLHDPLEQMKELIGWQWVNESTFPYPRNFVLTDPRMDSNASNLHLFNRLDQMTKTKSKRPPSTVASDAIVPVDSEITEQICKYALSAIENHNHGQANKICLEKVLGAKKSEVDLGICYIMLLRAKDSNGDSNTYCAITNDFWDYQVPMFVSKPLQEYQI
ncbi:OLC1v1027146C3 [Oldenlandia corymbosa var. corymbosa]|uniref:OLC1v1027146C3 n=1 Tax=Oldenlandia corymbosa var. corymbosa TaxID=529605 RepID=A0AAV1C8T1_OLDCO|nr:OLC1v1027146C3 [Oldenlandia corymbosa var. corymbosa]